MKQPQTYHNFASRNVKSNIFILLTSLYGLIYKSHTIERILFFQSFFLTSVGSMYYHSNPNDDTLFWDRLPMSVAFMCFSYMYLKDKYPQYIREEYLPILILIGMATVWWWRFSGNVLPYTIIQFVPPLLMMVFGINRVEWRWALILLFASKVTEYYDTEIYFWSNKQVSGHTLKHLMSAVAILLI